MDIFLITGVLSAFRMACENSSIEETATIGLVADIMKLTAAVALTSRLSLKRK